MECVSIIIPTFKGSKVIKRCLNSIISQTYKNIEIIVVDDNGENTDEQIATKKIVESISDNRIKYIYHKVNSNGSVARNTGFKASTGRYIFYFDDDDMLDDFIISIMVEKLSNTDETIGGIYCGFRRKYESGFIKEYLSSIAGNILFEYLMEKTSICTSTIIFKREIVITVNGFDESFKRHQDIEMIARVLSKKSLISINVIGVTKIEEKRNYPKNAIVLKEQGEYLLNKINKYLDNNLTKKQINKIYRHYYINWAKWFFSEGRFIRFIRLAFKSHRPIKCFYLSLKYTIAKIIKG